MRDISTNSFRLPDHNAMCQLFPKIDLACKVYQQIKAGTEHKAKDKMDVQHVCPNGPGHLHHHRLLASKTTLSCWKKAYTFFPQSDHCSKQTPHCRVSNVCAKISAAGDRCTLEGGPSTRYSITRPVRTIFSDTRRYSILDFAVSSILGPTRYST